MYNQSVLKSPRKQGKTGKFFVSKADDTDLNMRMAL